MNIALNIRAENNTAKPILNLWDEVASFEHEPSMLKLNYAPHFTFAIYENLEEQLAKTAFRNISKSLSKIQITFSEIAYFDVEKLVLWLRAEDETELHSIHVELHDHLPVENCHEYYKPTVWQPHCTLGVDIAPARRSQAIEFANEPIEPFKVKFDIFDCVTFLPVTIMEEVELR